jgi:peptidyl-prolyl cis-trans isomerase D
MIRVFRKYQKTVGGILILIVAALVMSSFGVDLAHRDQRADLQTAFTVDEAVVSKADFQRKVREVESQYRKMFGSQYEQLAKQFGINVPQNVLDSMVDATVLEKHLNAQGYAASDEEVREMIKQQFPGGYDPSALLSSGITPAQFLKDIEDEAKRTQFFDILNDVSSPTDSEKKSQFIKNESKYKIQYVSFSPAKLASFVKEPSSDELNKYFQENQEEYRTKPKASFNFIAFHPENYLSEIEVANDEVEFYYTDNENEFKNPESLNLQHVQILFPKDNDPVKLASAKEKAKEVLEKAKSGEDFKSLALKYSDDVTTKTQAGNLGWVPKGRYSAAFDEKTYAKKDGGIADLIEMNYGFHIVKVNGYKEASVKPLTEVKDSIIAKLKNEQAPAIADAKAREFFDKFLSSEQSLISLAQSSNLKVQSIADMIDEDSKLSDIPGDVQKKIFESIPEIKQFIESKKSAFIVELTNQKESEIPTLESVKDKVLKNYKLAQSQKVAKEFADNFLNLIQSGTDFSQAAKTSNGEVNTVENVKYTDQNKTFDSEDIKAEVFSVTAIPSKPTKIFYNDGAYLAFAVLDRKEADFSKATTEQLKSLSEEVQKENLEKFRKNILDALKSSSRIDITPSLLNEL